MTPFLNTNGFLLTRAWIDRLNVAGLYAMQLSVDNVTPNDITKKSLKPLLPRLRLLAAHAKFRVRLNTVLGSGPPEAFHAVKPFASTCPIAYAHHASRFDRLRSQDGAPIEIAPSSPLIEAMRLVRKAG